jgi:hypothetical protein
MRLFAFFGPDVEPRGVERLRALRDDGVTLLALDGAAVALATSADIACDTVEDWLGDDGLVRCREAGDAMEQAWFEPAREAFTAQGLCWPAFDRHAMTWFWPETQVAAALAARFRERGVDELGYVAGRRSKARLYYYAPSDVPGALWRASLPDIARPRLRAWRLPPLRHLFRRIHRGGEQFLVATLRLVTGTPERKRVGIHEPAPEALAGQVVLAASAAERQRFATVAGLRAWPGGLSAVTLESDRRVAHKVARYWQVPTLPGPAPGAIDRALARRFRAAWRHARDAATGTPWESPLTDLDFHFEFYCAVRWPTLAASFARWRTLWARAHPAAVLVSSLPDSESQLPAAAARDLGIPTLALPHAAVPGHNRLGLSAEHIVCATPLEKAFYDEHGALGNTTHVCRGILSESSYPVTASASGGRADFHVLCLLDPVGNQGTLTQYVAARAQLAGLRALADVPGDLVRRVSVAFKHHPAFPEQGLLRAAGPDVKGRLLPLDSALAEALATADVVVALNYSGSALHHAIVAGKPVLFLFTDPAFAASDVLPHDRAMTGAGEILRHLETLWPTLRALAGGGEPLQRLRERAARFARERVDASAHPALEDVLARVTAVRDPPATRSPAR